MAPTGDPEDEMTDLLDQALCRANVWQAYKKVRSNRGAAGVDGMTVDDLLPYCRVHWERIRSELFSGTYQPQPVRKVEIAKPDGGGTRTLGIPTVLDRLIQQALLQVLEPLLDPSFSESSHGFRPGRSAHDALRQAQAHMATGRRWVVDLDLEKFFDRVQHDVLMDRLSRRVSDRRVLRLVGRYLRAGLMEGGVISPRSQGVPQGGPMTP